MKKVIIGLVPLVAVMLISAWLLGNAKSWETASVSSNAKISSAETQKPIAAHDHAQMVRVPAYLTQAPNLITLRPTLSPELFTGNKKLAYQAAREIPQTLAQLPCYCHCDKGHGHKSLHSCFESEHGENCGVCIGEAIMAYQLQKKANLNVPEIRDRIIAAYGTAANE
jgi:hypothetical protein